MHEGLGYGVSLMGYSSVLCVYLLSQYVVAGEECRPALSSVCGIQWWLSGGVEDTPEHNNLPVSEYSGVHTCTNCHVESASLCYMYLCCRIEHSVISRRQDTRADITMSTWAPDKK